MEEAPRFQKPKKQGELTVQDMPPRSPGAEAIWLEVRRDDCAECDLGVNKPGQAAKTTCLTGSGPVPCRAMIVGEGPGLTEDDLERPFVGDAGEYLDNLLLDVGLQSEDIYRTNATKCLPPRNDKDDWVAQAVKPCKPYLMEEIERVKPDVILVMGNPALKSLTGLSGITKKRGMEFYDEGLKAWIIVTLHPAGVLRAPHRHAELFADLQKFARRLRGEETGLPEPEVVTCNTVAEVKQALDELKDERVVTVDLETQGFDHFRPESKIWCLALSADPSKAYLIPLEHPESPFVNGPDLGDEEYSYKLAKRKKSVAGAVIRQWIEQPWRDVARPELHEVWELLRTFISEHRMNGHNVKFDAIWLARRGVEAWIWFCTMMSAHILNENRELGLGSLSVTELGVQGWGKKKVQFVPPDALSIMGPYCGTDAAYDHALYLKDRVRLEENPELARLFSAVSMPAVRVFKKSEMAGIWLDEVRAKDRLEKAREERSEVECRLNKRLPAGFQDRAREIALEDKSIFNSPDFLSQWLFSDAPTGLGLTPLRRTKKGFSTDEHDLLILGENNEAVAELLEFRKRKKTVEFFETWLGAVGPGGWVHPSFNLAGTVTGRKSSGFHVVPRESTRPGGRSIFGAPPDYIFVECDFSQIELRIAAWLADEPTMLAIFRNGGDIHLYTAALVTGKMHELQDEMGLSELSIGDLSAVPEFNERLKKVVTKEERRAAKAVNFGFLYGMGAAGFRIYALESYGVTLSAEECVEFRNAYFMNYSGLIPWHEQQKRKARRPPYEVRSPIDRIRRLPMILSSDWEIQGRAERQSINSPVQGMAPDLVQLAVNVLDEMFGDGDEARFVGEVHDSAFFYVRANALAQWLPRIKHVMEHPPIEEIFRLEVPVPLEVDIAIGQHWGETSTEAAQEYLREAA